MSNQSFYKSFISTSLTKVETRTLFSNHCIDSQGLKKAYSMINDSNNTVLLPVYHTTQNNDIVDTQMSITGSCKRYESFDAAAIREIKEEIGLSPELLQLICTESLGKKRNKHQLQTYITDANTCVLHSEQEQEQDKCSVTNFPSDDKKRKVQIIVYGRIDPLLRIAETINHRPPSHDNLINNNQKFYIGGIRIVFTQSIHDTIFEVSFQKLINRQENIRKRLFWIEQKKFRKILLSYNELDNDQDMFRLGGQAENTALEFNIFLPRLPNALLVERTKNTKDQSNEFHKLFSKFDPD
jgi:ADP-ribose pyrophosphatase YjhB (NUDIX family)